MDSSTNLKVALIGDGVLDNHFWLGRPAEDVRAQTEHSLRRAYPSRNVEALNSALEESTVTCVLQGRYPASCYQRGRMKANMEPYPMDEDGVVKPLNLLRRARPTHVVLSVGGNDARVRFLQSRDLEVVTQRMMNDGFVANLRRLVEFIKAEVTSNIVLVYVYMPQSKMIPILSFLPPTSVSQRLLVNFSKFFIEIANDHCLPVIDLSRTFDPNKRGHYGSTPIESSNLSGQFIADLILKVLQKIRFGEETSGKVFSGANEEAQVQDLAPDAGFSYAQEFQAFLDSKRVGKSSSWVIGFLDSKRVGKSSSCVIG